MPFISLKRGKRINRAVEVGLPGLGFVRRAVGAHLPGRTMAGQRVLLVLGDRVRGHASGRSCSPDCIRGHGSGECQYSLSCARPLGARCGLLFLHSGHCAHNSFFGAAACCFALSLFGLIRMLSKNLDESMGMADYDNAMQKASSLDIPITHLAPCAAPIWSPLVIDHERGEPLSRPS